MATKKSAKAAHAKTDHAKAAKPAKASKPAQPKPAKAAKASKAEAKLHGKGGMTVEIQPDADVKTEKPVAAAPTNGHSEKLATSDKSTATKKAEAGAAAKAKPNVAAKTEDWGAELARRRNKPIVLDADEAAPDAKVGGIAKAGRATKGDDEASPVKTMQARDIDEATKSSSDQPIPEAFLLLAAEGTWDERGEKVGAGGMGGALLGALLLEAVHHGVLQVQRDRFVVQGEGAPTLVPLLAKLRGLNDTASLDAMKQLAADLPTLIRGSKASLVGKGLAEAREWRYLGIFRRSTFTVTNATAQERLRNRLRRAIAGGGTPDAATILLLGLADAAGVLDSVVPAEALDYNRKRLSGLLRGQDILGYKVDAAMRDVQENAVRTILDDVRALRQ